MQNGRILEARIALGSVAPIPVRGHRVEGLMAGEQIYPALIEECRRILLSEITPIDDARSTREYRKRVAQNLTGGIYQVRAWGDRPEVMRPPRKRKPDRAQPVINGGPDANYERKSRTAAR